MLIQDSLNVATRTGPGKKEAIRRLLGEALAKATNAGTGGEMDKIDDIIDLAIRVTASLADKTPECALTAMEGLHGLHQTLSTRLPYHLAIKRMAACLWAIEQEKPWASRQ